MRSDSYNTKQKDLILEVIKKKGEFKVKDIYDTLEGKVGLTTIYRFLDSLVDSGGVTKYINKRNETCFQYLEKCENKNHFYLKCEKCGDMIHIDCGCIVDLSDHILKKHKFITNKENVIIKGICERCR